MNKKVINIMLIMIFLVSLISFSANAAPRDIIRAGLDPIEDFFSGGWQNYEKTVAFVVFFFLFFSAFLIGAKKAFGGELTRAHKVFAFVAAFLSSMIIVTTMRFDWVNLKYVGWFLIGVLVLFVMYSLLSKLFGKHKFWAFLLAIILTALLLWLVWYLMNEGRPLDGLGRVSDWFGRLGKGEKAKEELWPGGVPPVGKGEEPGKVKPTVTAVKESKFGSFFSKTPMWVFAIILVIIGTTFGAGSVGKLRGQRFFGGIKKFYGYPFSRHKGITYKYGKRELLKSRLKKYIADALDILKDPRLTEEERKIVELRLKEAISTIKQIEDEWVNPREEMFKKYKKNLEDLIKGKLREEESEQSS